MGLADSIAVLTQTTIAAIRTLVHIGLNPSDEPLSIRHIAEYLGESPTYLAKVTRHLVRAGILRAHRGVAGGIELNREPEAITLRAVVEACQGTILADFCQETPTMEGVCAFHVAAVELHQAMIQVLDRWTVGQLIEEPGSSGRSRAIPCLLHPRASGSTRLPGGKRPGRGPTREVTEGASRSRRQAR